MLDELVRTVQCGVSDVCLSFTTVVLVWSYMMAVLRNTSGCFTKTKLSLSWILEQHFLPPSVN